MRVADLIAELENMDPNALVLVAHQPNHPLQEKIVNVVEYDTNREEMDEVEAELASGYLSEDETVEAEAKLARLEEDNREVVYITADGHPWDLSPYAPRAVFNR